MEISIEQMNEYVPGHFYERVLKEHQRNQSHGFGNSTIQVTITDNEESDYKNVTAIIMFQESASIHKYVCFGEKSRFGKSEQIDCVYLQPSMIRFMSEQM
ncbi:hypothetical protein [Paenibacillus macquariensis]|uniref:Uncharacterized protein n=1 Tax=Paenibacillus macquariensis TaxID=948756 RepID=A0ABY1K757_9BACL|nr:hypothetical protein [Paenibacillus macquariensis]MEC0092520.1 hypothetical protein [Paenibacillus macquariensis]OAB35476.1 hypothetical protein PMSM_09480 [Paenibacillus macquariensis subsp. macquariensis]SIR35138.1 hypothetical protein SAMN05421578_111146 [Paenibacillus macquariensis]